MLKRTVSQARASLPDLLSQVAEGQEVTITRHGQPVAVLVRPDALRTRRAEAAFRDAARLHEMLERARKEPRPVQGMTPERADELVQEIRAGRDAR